VCTHARIPNGHHRKDPREENRACRTSRRGSSCVSGSWRTKLFLWQAERGSRRTRRHPRDDPRAEVSSDVRVGVRVRVGVVECQLNAPSTRQLNYFGITYSRPIRSVLSCNPRSTLALKRRGHFTSLMSADNCSVSIDIIRRANE